MLDSLLDRTWTKKYTCNEFACEVWQLITNEDLTERLNNYLNGTGSFTAINAPESPCIVFFKRKNADTHVGIFYDNKLIHLTDKGVHYVPLDLILGFQAPSFYK